MLNKNLTVLFHNLNYMNMAELKNFCLKKNIPFQILIELPNGKIKKTAQLDRKATIIARIKHYLITGKIKAPTLFPNKVVSLDKLPLPLQAKHRVLYGEYKNTNLHILNLLKELTHGQFEFGAIAQQVLLSCWASGRAPTYTQFAKLWLLAKKKHNQPNPEWAYLTDKKHGMAGTAWKKMRLQRARLAIAALNKW